MNNMNSIAIMVLAATRACATEVASPSIVHICNTKNGPCGDVNGLCLVMTPIDGNPVGAFVTTLPCDFAAKYQLWTFDNSTGQICSAVASTYCLYVCEQCQPFPHGYPVRASNTSTPSSWSYTSNTLCTNDKQGATVLDTSGSIGLEVRLSKTRL
jgi:hypothetical protein